MKSYPRIIAVLLLSALTVCAAACGGGSSVAPTPTQNLSLTPTATSTPTPTPTPEPEMMPPSIGYLPEGWQLVSEIYYGQYIEEGEPKTGSLQYKNEDDTALVYIKYGDLPAWASGKESDPEGLLEEFLIQGCESCEKPDPDETGTMTFCGGPAAYASFSLPEQSAFAIVVIYADASRMIEVNAVWWAADKESEVMAIIDSVSY